jgi:hypothetical protein
MLLFQYCLNPEIDLRRIRTALTLIASSCCEGTRSCGSYCHIRAFICILWKPRVQDSRMSVTLILSTVAFANLPGCVKVLDFTCSLLVIHVIATLQLVGTDAIMPRCIAASDSSQVILVSAFPCLLSVLA